MIKTSKKFRTATSAVALAVAVGMLMPASAVAQTIPDLFADLFTDNGGMWFVSIEGGQTGLSVPEEVGLVVDSSPPWISEFNDAFSGAFTIGRKAGQVDISISIRGGQFAADEIHVHEDDTTPYGELDSSTTGDWTSNDTSSFITGTFEAGYTLPSSQGGPTVRIFGGLRAEKFVWNRYADVEYLTSSDATRSYNGNETSTFVGVGPSIGVEIEVPVGDETGFSVFGGASGGILLGTQERVYPLGGESGFAAVPFANAEAGVNFAVSDYFNLSVGYQADLRANVISSLVACRCADDVQQNQAVTHGAFFRATAYFD
ncbi:MAG: hypothetical protein GXP01_04175 [Alphaproteobacteria bacterium]|nr:hypothetical protein [Alphaproteobacteria bacterium]